MLNYRETERQRQTDLFWQYLSHETKTSSMLCGWWVESDFSVSLCLFIMTLEMTDKGRNLSTRNHKKIVISTRKSKKYTLPRKWLKIFFSLNFSLMLMVDPETKKFQFLIAVRIEKAKMFVN